MPFLKHNAILSRQIIVVTLRNFEKLMSQSVDKFNYIIIYSYFSLHTIVLTTALLSIVLDLKNTSSTRDTFPNILHNCIVIFYH